MKKFLALCALALGLLVLVPSVAFASTVITGDPLGDDVEAGVGGLCAWYGDQISTPGNGQVDYAMTVVTENCRTGALTAFDIEFSFQIMYLWPGDGQWHTYTSGPWSTWDHPSSTTGSFYWTQPNAITLWAHNVPMVTMHSFHIGLNGTWGPWSAWRTSPQGIMA